ncbi:MAG: DUF6893 family small protein [Acidimicrobiales bacterium]
MILRILVLGALGGAAALGVKLWPDVQRYIKIKSM